METPTNKKIRPQRTPTPKLSERKKSLFGRERRSPIREETEILSDINGIAPLSPVTRKHAAEECVRWSTGLRSRKYQSNSPDINLKKSPDSQRTDSILESPKRRASSRNKWSILARKTYSGPKSQQNYEDEEMLDEDTHESQTQTTTAVRSTPATPKTFTPSPDELRILFDDTLKFQSKKKTRNLFDENSVSSSDDEVINRRKQPSHPTCISGHKRGNPDQKQEGPKEKLIKLQENVQDSSVPNVSLSISTKSFYSQSKTTQEISPNRLKILPPIAPHLKETRRKSHNSYKNKSGKINKGVHHKIRRDNKKTKSTSKSVAEILKSIRVEKFKSLPSQRIFDEKLKKVSEILKNSQNPIQMARPLNIIPNAIDTSVRFSDSDDESEQSSSETENESIFREIIKEESEQIPAQKRFFKFGGHLVRNQYKLMNKMKVTVANGKLHLLPDKKKKRRLAKPKLNDNSFATEQKTVDDIIQKLDASGDDSSLLKPGPLADGNENIITSVDNLSESINADGEYTHFRKRIPYNTDDPQLIEQQHLLLDFLISNQICTEENFKIFIADPDNHKEEAAKIVDSLVVVVPESGNNLPDKESEQPQLVETNYQHFRDRLPYNTTDPALIEQQETLLDFLITNEICNEETFNIFIADPDNHREEAALIIDNLVTVTSEDADVETVSTHSDEHIPFTNATNMCFDGDTIMDLEECPTTDREPLQPLNQLPNEIENIQPNTKVESIQQSTKFKIGGSSKLFPVFYPKKCQPLLQKSSRKYGNPWNRGLGSNQYQLDFGQKDFGAKTCSKCGLVYTVHEPEEEKLHHEYHNSLHILKFKGWIDEDVVVEYPEWGYNGRIIKVTNFSHPKRQERVRDVLKVVDKELGFSSYIIPDTFVAYFAIKRQQIVGFCLSHPLDKANKYICANGIDCCTEETYPAKCGISRIWVSPFHRRERIASKLIKAVQMHTILGTHISLDEIAFSSPTVDGKAFASTITKRKDFLVYQ